MELFFSRSALGDLKAIKEYYLDEDVPDIGLQFVSAIIEHATLLIDNPDIGRKVPEFDEEKIRELIYPPFRIVYLKESNTIHVIRVWRSERLLVLPDEGVK